jgi:hypothetical protein
MKLPPAHPLARTLGGLALSLVAAATLAGADIVLLDNGQRIAGTIDPSIDAGPGQVAINTGNGVLRVDRKRIAGEDLGYPARRQRVKNDDLSGLVALARWCRGKAMNVEALELATLAIALPGVDLPTRALHARLIDELKGPEEALELYRAYRQDGGRDETTIARLAQLEKAIAAFEAGGDVAGAVAATEPGGVAAPPRVKPTLQGGLEAKGWDPEALQWSNPVEAKVTTVDLPDGTAPALQIAFKAGDKDKAAVKRSIHLTIGDDSVLTMQALNPGDRPVSLAVAVKTGGKYLFHESPQMMVKPGKEPQTLRFDLKASNFKSAATSWASTGKVADLGDIKELQLLVYNGQGEGTLLITGMGFPAKKDL